MILPCKGSVGGLGWGGGDSQGAKEPILYSPLGLAVALKFDLIQEGGLLLTHPEMILTSIYLREL